jgi:putative ABC transport system permease protein
VTFATLENPTVRRPANGGVPARRAVVRWAVRLARREWKQQLLIFALITAAVTATFIASAVATTTPAKPVGVLGTAQDAATLTGTGPQISAQVTALRSNYGQVDVIVNQSMSVPGSVTTFDLRAQDPHGPFGQPLLSLVSGKYPTTASQVAVTSGVASEFNLRVGGRWTLNGVTRTVTGIVQAPQSLLEKFALVIPGQVAHPDQATALFNASGADIVTIRTLIYTAAHKPVPPDDVRVTDVFDTASLANDNAINPQSISLAAAILGMLLIALVGVGGFSVLAQRRLRAIGMLAAQGATERHIRLVVRANGVVTGVAGAGAGFLLGFIGWLAYRPVAQSSAHHVIGTFQLPWTVIIASMALAVLATYFAASRPAKAISRVPVIAALAGRPTPPKKRGRLVIPIGIVFLVISFLLLGLAGTASGTPDSTGPNPLRELALGIILLAVAVIMLAPTTLGVVAWLGKYAPISARLALRDLSRYRQRSGPALAAIALATLIAVLTCVESAGRLSNPLDYGGPNLASNQLIVYSPDNPYIGSGGGSAPSTVTPAQAQAVAGSIARQLGATSAITLYTASVGLSHAAGGRSWSGPVYVATPQLLSAFGIRQSQIDAAADVLTMRPGLSTMSLMQLQNTIKNAGGGSSPCITGGCIANPPIQEVSQLPAGTSAPNTVVTEHGLQALRVQSSVTVGGWFIQAPSGLTAAQIRGAQQAAADAGLSVESRNSIPSLATIVNDATVFGIVLALAILGMSVGLVRSEAARDLRTLTATGGSGTTRRILVATTAGALGFAGALIGMAGGYLAAAGFARTNQLDGLSSLDSIPVANLLLILIGMPLIAAAVSWLLALREPPSISRQPLE